MSQDAIERALTELAARADARPAPDVVRAVHRRARRNAAVRATAAATAVVAVVAGASVLATGANPFDRSVQPSRKDPAPSGLTIELHPNPDLAASLPRRQPGIPAVVDVVVRGNLPTGRGWPVERSVLGVQLEWGDGTFGGQGAYGVQGLDRTALEACPPAGGPVQAWESDEPMTHHYERPGTYTVRYRTLLCGMPTEVTRSITLTVKEQ